MCLCPGCGVTKADLDKLGLLQDDVHQQQPRLFSRLWQTAVDKARRLIYKVRCLEICTGGSSSEGAVLGPCQGMI